MDQALLRAECTEGNKGQFQSLKTSCFSEAFKQGNSCQGNAGPSENTWGQGAQGGLQGEHQRETAPVLNSKAEQNELVKVGKRGPTRAETWWHKKLDSA